MSIKTLNEALIYGINELKSSDISSARIDAELLLGFILGMPQEKLIISQKSEISTKDLLKFKKLIVKRKKHVPIAYLTGSKEFYGTDFCVNKNVLVPRPETETLIEEILKHLAPTNPKIPTHRKNPNILEVGTGSGCIALTLAKYLPKSEIIAIDISEEALTVAERNRANLKIANVEFAKSNLLDKIEEKPDILVANLPYVNNNMKNLLKSPDSKALRHEPQIALRGGKDGLDVYRKLFKQIRNKGWEGLTVFIEIGHNQTNNTKRILKELFPSTRIELKKDIAGKNRTVIIEI